jgi:hypothetical protein
VKKELCCKFAICDSDDRTRHFTGKVCASCGMRCDQCQAKTTRLNPIENEYLELLKKAHFKSSEVKFFQQADGALTMSEMTNIMIDGIEYMRTTISTVRKKADVLRKWQKKKENQR